MATADPSFFATQATIASANYPAASAASINCTTIGSGKWAFRNPDAALSILISFDGVNDAIILPPNAEWYYVPALAGPRVWAKLSAAGSVVLTANLTSGVAVR